MIAKFSLFAWKFLDLGIQVLSYIVKICVFRLNMDVNKPLMHIDQIARWSFWSVEITLRLLNALGSKSAKKHKNNAIYS